MTSALARVARNGATLLVVSIVLTLGFLALAGCGGGGGGGGGDDDGIDSVGPDFPAERATTVTISGSGFGPAGPATVRLTATAGTPFTGGTAAFLDVPATVVDDDTITFTSPIGTLCPTANVGLSVRVTLASLEEFDTGVVAVTMLGPTYASFSPSPVPGTVATPFTIGGTNFGPVPGAATVTFTALAGTPFAGGTSSTAVVAGSVTSGTTITGTTPVATSAADFAATVSVEFAGGSCVSSPAGAVPFAMTGPPVLSTSLVGDDLTVAAGDRVTFTVTATDPEGDPVTLWLANPPAGVTFGPVIAQTSPHTETVAWVVDETDGPGPIPLRFESTGGGSATVSRKTVWVHVTPWTLRSLRTGDVTGDGTADVVVMARGADVGGVADVGAIYVWAGATTPSGTPTATLAVSGPAANDRLGNGGLRLADVSGDGVLDVLAATDLAEGPALNDAGAIYVWHGGVALTGAVAPTATLTAGALQGAFTQLAARPVLWQTGDVTGDGTDDVVACAPTADEGAGDTGAVYLWKGGAGLTGALTPHVRLLPVAPAAGDELGRDGVQLADLTGDGTLDVFSGAPRVGIFDTGALYLWNGGAVLAAATGTKAADATMNGTTLSAFDNLGAGAGSAIRLAEATGDGILDVLAPIPTATVGGTSQTGAIFVWYGGATLTGAKNEDATLFVTGAVLGDHLGAGAATRLLVADVSGDGTNDVVGVANDADVGPTVDAGSAYVWLGGATLTGAKAADATLRLAAPTGGDGLGRGGTRVAELTGDGVLDVVTSTPNFDAGLIPDVGAVHVWAGGGGLTGTVNPTAALLPAGATGGEMMGFDTAHPTFTPRFGDVSNDGVADVVVPAPGFDAGAITDTGAVFAWAGGGALAGAPAPLATLTVTGALAQDRLGASHGSGVTLVDVTGDGVTDVLSAAMSADLGATDAGAIYAWRGGATLTGPKPQDATLRALAAMPGDQLAGGMPDGVAWDVFDLTGDGTRDVVGVACLADTATLTDAGAGYLFAGGVGITGTVTPTAVFRAPNATDVDALGRNLTSDLLFGADVTADGTLDLLLGAADYTGTGPAFRGGVFLWKGGALTGTPAATSSFLVPGAQTQDHLGN
jgi:hypothetical protein